VTQALKLDPEERCDRCGVVGAFDLGDRRLCEECYRSFGSCCLEFGADDLTRRDEDQPASAEPEPKSSSASR
jgi:hypothetical protein